MCGAKGMRQTVCGVVAPRLGGLLRRIYASHCGLAGIVARTKTSTKLAHRRGDIMAPVSHFTARATTGAGLAFSLCVYGVPQTLTWALPKEKGKEKERGRKEWGERGVGQKHFHVAHTRTRSMNLFFVLLRTQQVNDVV